MKEGSIERKGRMKRRSEQGKQRKKEKNGEREGKIGLKKNSYIFNETKEEISYNR